jgi:hypothetical protein
VSDPRADVRGRGVLDIASIEQGRRHNRLRYRLTTYDRWKPAFLANGGQISFYFDTDADAGHERRLDVRHVGGRLAYAMTDRARRLIGRGRARQTSPHTVVVEFARGLLGRGIRSYRWFATTGFRCRDRFEACGDTAPRRGWWILRRLGPPPPPRTAEPRPIARQGYRQVFWDEFEKFDSSIWERSVFWEPRAPASDIYTQNGVLHIVSKRASGYPNRSVETLKARSFRRGYFEARMRWTKGNGAWPAFWLSATNHAHGIDCPPLNAELDIFEGQGSEPNIFYGTLHKNTNDLCNIPDQTNEGDHRLRVDLSARFHIYSALWTETEVRWYLDGVEVTRTPVFASTDQPMFIIFQMWTGGWTRDTDATTPAALHTEVDWVRVWQKERSTAG